MQAEGPPPPFWAAPESLRRLSRISRPGAAAADKSVQKQAQDSESAQRRLLRERLPWLPAALYSRITYYRAHLTAFALLGLLGGLLLFGIEGGERPFTHCAFTAVSALTQTGLIVVDTSALRKPSQVFMLLLITAGGGVLGSTIPITLRRLVFLWSPPAPVSAAAPPGARARAAVVAERHELHFEALTLVRRAILAYWAACLLLAFLMLGGYLQAAQRATMAAQGVAPWWFAGFHVISALHNAGFALTSTNLTPFRADALVLNLTAFLILAGNTAHPIFLRLMVYGWWRWEARRAPGGRRATVLAYVMRHPRACALQLFPPATTATLALIIAGLTLAEFGLLLGFDARTPPFAGLSGYGALNLGWFHSVDVRTAGFNALDVSALSPPIWVVWVAAMYLSAMPVAVSMRASNPARRAAGTASAAGHELRSMLTTDLFWLYAPWAFLVCVEAGRLGDATLTPFSLLFENASALGTVGLSLGYPGTVTSLAARLSPVSQWALMLTMLVGRNRGLPRDSEQLLALEELYLSRASVDAVQAGRSATGDPSGDGGGGRLHPHGAHAVVHPLSLALAARSAPPPRVLPAIADTVEDSAPASTAYGGLGNGPAANGAAV